MSESREATARRLADEIVRKHIHPDTGCGVDWEQIEALIAATLKAEVSQVEARILEAQRERDAAIGKPYQNIIQREMLRDEYVRGLERAKEIVYQLFNVLPNGLVNAIQAEIDKARGETGHRK